MAIEDFTTYIEEDDYGKLTVTASKALASDVEEDEDVWLYKDKGVDHFDALDIDFEIRIESTSQVDCSGGVALANVIGDVSDFAATDFTCRIRRGGSDYRIVLTRGNWLANDPYVCSHSTLYYCTIERSASNDTVSVKIYSDAGRTDLLDTLALANFGTEKWRYVYGFINRNSSTGGRNLDGYTQNLDLKEAAPIVAPTVTTQAVSGIKATSATGNGNITDNGNEDCDKRGIVYDTTSHGDPSNTAPADSDYANYEEEADGFGTGAFTRSLADLSTDVTHYARAYAHNSEGYSYGDEVSFTPAEAKKPTFGLYLKPRARARFYPSLKLGG